MFFNIREDNSFIRLCFIAIVALISIDVAAGLYTNSNNSFKVSSDNGSLESLEQSDVVDYLSASELSDIILDDSISRLVILYASWCGHCRNEMRQINNLMESLSYEEKEAVRIIAVSVDQNKEDLITFLKSFGPMSFENRIASTTARMNLQNIFSKKNLRYRNAIPFVAFLKTDGTVIERPGLRLIKKEIRSITENRFADRKIL